MHLRLLISIIFFAFTYASAQKTVPEITVAEAKDHEGERVTICGQIKETFYNAKSKGEPTMLNFGAAYPNHTFSCIIWKDDLVNFDYKPVTYLKGKQICVTGTVKMYKGKPEMELHSQEQVFE